MKNYLIGFFCFVISLSFGQIDTDQKKSNFFADASYGFSYRINSIPDGIPIFLRDHLQKIKSGTNLDLSVGFKIDQKNYIKLLFNNFSTSNEFNNIDQIRVNDKYSINFVGAAYGAEYTVGNNNNLANLEFGLGASMYSNKEVFPSNDIIDLRGSALTLFLAASYMFKVSEKLYLGPHVSYHYGSIRNFDVYLNETKVDSFKLEPD